MPHWVSLVQLVGQLALVPEQVNGAHVMLPGGLVKNLQVPGEGSPLQLSQAPLQAVSQHTASEQNPLRHSVPVLQPTPSDPLHEIVRSVTSRGLAELSWVFPVSSRPRRTQR